MNDLYNIRTISPDSIRYGKDCKDFVCLNDGTIIGDCRYCNLSNQCVQVDVIGGIPVPMESNTLEIRNPNTGEVVEEVHYCTGFHDLRPLKERIEDDKVR
jgi:hypothetical protein